MAAREDSKAAAASAAAKGKGGRTGGDYFATTKKGEIHELKTDLNDTNREKVKDAVKKVIAAMTVGKDVGQLFTDVVKSMQTSDIELKKLVYLYIINYARTQPDKAILIVNTFQKDARDPSPLVRALAIRTMGCIRVDKITEYLAEPLMTALKDKDPYVRKTAAVSVAKMYDINAELVEEQDFLEKLRDMIADPNPMVVANAVAALAEISESSGKDVFQINAAMLQKLLAALNECTEWGQVFLLDCLAQYEPSPKEAEQIIERVQPRLQHVNSAVAMSAVKVIMKYLNIIKNPELERSVVTTKLPPPLITLLSEQKPEIQYVALRNINLIVQKRPDILSKEVKHFFCKYNDPIYVKMEKLEIMIRLANAANVEQVLMEFKEYASEVDVEFVRKSVRAIGRVAIKIDVAAERCIKVLLELIANKVNYVVQEAIIVIKDIFRKYPNRYESIISTLCENLDTLDEPEAKASMAWIIGEYAARIENAPELLDGFVDAFQDDAPQVQLQVLTAVVKLYLRRPEESKAMVTKVLNMATENSDNPDLRDRAYIYWRLLHADPEAAHQVVLAERPVISDDTYSLEPSLLDTLIANISTLASIYHKPPEAFVKGGRTFVFHSAGDNKESDEEQESGGEEDSGEKEAAEDDSAPAQGQNRDDDEDDEDEKSAPKAAAAAAGPKVVDLFGGLDDVLSGPTLEASRPAVNRKIILPAAKGDGLQISCAVVRRDGKAALDMVVQNQSQKPLKTFLVKLDKNFYGLTPTQPRLAIDRELAPNSQAECVLTLETTGEPNLSVKPGLLKIAIKTELGVAFMQETVPAYVLFQENGQLEKADFLGMWKSLGDDEVTMDLGAGDTSDADTVREIVEKHRAFFVAKRTVQRGDVLYLSTMLNNEHVLLELTCGNGVSGVAKSKNKALAQAALEGVQILLQESS